MNPRHEDDQQLPPRRTSQEYCGRHEAQTNGLPWKGMVQQPEGTDITMMVMSTPQNPAALLAPPLASLLQQRIDSTHNYNINIATTSTNNQSNDCLLALLDGYDSGAMRNANFITFNNLGVFFLRERKYFEAIYSLMEAAKFVVGDDRFTVRAAPTFQAFYLLLDDFRTRVNGCGIADKGHVDTPPKLDEKSEDALRHESIYAFQYPIVLSTDATGPEAGNLAAEATIQLSLITLYNMGLAFHRAALDLNSLHILQQAWCITRLPTGFSSAILAFWCRKLWSFSTTLVIFTVSCITKTGLARVFSTS